MNEAPKKDVLAWMKLSFDFHSEIFHLNEYEENMNSIITDSIMINVNCRCEELLITILPLDLTPSFSDARVNTKMRYTNG